MYTKAKHENVGSHLDENTSYYHFGLFGHVKNGVIKNVRLKNVNITNGMTNGYVRSLQGTGSLIGHTSGEVLVDNVKILGDIFISGEYKVGGIIGSSSGSCIKVSNSIVKGSLNSLISGTDKLYKDTNNFGGLIGFSGTTTVLENVISDINVDGYTCGGIVGNVTDGSFSLTNAGIYGNISNSEGSVVGGIIGGRFVDMSLKNCYFLGSVFSKEKDYVDVLVSKYGDGFVTISKEEVYFNMDNYDSSLISNSIDGIGKSLEELKNIVPSDLK